MMNVRRNMQMISTLLAVMSLFVSAVSACACTHHEPVKQVSENSCHGPAHEQPKAEIAPMGDHFESDCNCFNKKPVPAIIAKTDDKRVGIETHSAEPVFASTAFVPVLAIEAAPSPYFDPPDLGYKTALLSALPSRAPPRL